MNENSENEKIPLSVVIIGHVDSGKSTLLGHFLKLCSSLNEGEGEGSGLGDEVGVDVEDNQNVWKCNEYAMIVDRLRAERQRGLTIDITSWKFETSKYSYTAINTPGHGAFIRNMITGTSQADIGLLMISAPLGEFECGWVPSPNGRTRDHILIAFTFGIRELIVGINKMDACNYDEIRYNEIIEEISTYFVKIGFKKTAITFIPVSGLVGDNLIVKSPHMPWYSGPTLMEALNSIKPPPRYQDKPLRMPIQDVYKISGVGIVAVGRVSTGVLKKGMSVTVSPSECHSYVKSIEIHHEIAHEASGGELAGFHCPDIQQGDIRRGYVVSDPLNEPAFSCESFQALVIVLNHPSLIECGYCPIMDCHTAHVAVRVRSLDELMGRQSAKSLQPHPKYIRNGDSCLITFEPLKPIVLEEYKQFPSLGSFTLRDSRRVVGVGIIKSVNRGVAPSLLSGKGARRRSDG